MNSPDQPSWRKPTGIALILLLIVVWAGLVATLARFVGDWPIFVQAAFYLVMGIGWIAPLKPLIRWMETGRWTASGPVD
jgi:predicted membrane channel-forming protein YqfA (hemolysin III family)